MGRKRFGIVGAGLIGLGTAIKLKEANPELDVVVWEKESQPGTHQSTHNSGVLHAGLYYKPGSEKARLAVSGIREMVQFCQEHNVRHEICGKIVLATDASELGRLETLYDRGVANGLKGLRKLAAEEIAEFEPHARGIAAVRVPEEGIVDYAGVVQAMKGVLARQGTALKLSTGIEKIQSHGNEWSVTTPEGEDSCDFLINCAGLHCDRIARLAGETTGSKIVPFRGEYFKLRPEAEHLVRHLIYPVPDPVFPFLGVHYTRMIGGGIEAGPNAVLALSREGYSKLDFSLRDSLEISTFPGIWKFLATHKKMCAAEVARSFSKHLFCKSLQRLVPDLQKEDLVPGGAGVRAQAMNHDGALVQDFEFIERPRALHVLNAPSPGATASLAIGRHIALTACRNAGIAMVADTSLASSPSL